MGSFIHWNSKYSHLKVKLSLSMPWRHMWEWVYSTCILSIGLDGVEWPAALKPLGNSPKQISSFIKKITHNFGLCCIYILIKLHWKSLTVTTTCNRLGHVRWASCGYLLFGKFPSGAELRSEVVKVFSLFSNHLF